MKKIIIISILLISAFSLKAQTTIECTVDTFYFFIMKHDTVILEPTMVTPGMAVTSNYQAVGAEMYMSDAMANCVNKIETDSLKMSDHSLVFFETKNNKIYVNFKNYNRSFVAVR